MSPPKNGKNSFRIHQDFSNVGVIFNLDFWFKIFELFLKILFHTTLDVEHHYKEKSSVITANH